MATDHLPDRKTVKEALRAIGLSNRQVHALLAKGWAGLVSERDAEVEELKDALESLKGTVSENRVS